MAEAITTSPVRLSYANQIFKPKAFQPGDTPKYSVVLMFDKKNKDDMATLKALLNGANADLAEKWPDPATRPRVPMMGHDSSPIKDGDKACDKQGVPIGEKNPEYQGHYIIRAASTRAPVVVDRARNAIIDTNAVYSGCKCNVSLNSYAYNSPKNKGVTFGLNGVQYWEDGERIGGGPPPLDQMFQAAASGANDPSNFGGGSDDFFGGGAGEPDLLGGTPPDDDIPFG